MSVLKELSCTLLYSSIGNSLVLFKWAKNLCLSINQLTMKRPRPGGFFLAFSHNTILLTPWMQMKTPKSNSLTRKDWYIHYCILWPVITASPQYFAPEGKKNPFHWEWGACNLFTIFLVILFPLENVSSSTLPEVLTWKSVFSFWLVFQVLLILIVLFCFSVEFLPQITTLLTDLGASQAEVSWK